MVVGGVRASGPGSCTVMVWSNGFLRFTSGATPTDLLGRIPTARLPGPCTVRAGALCVRVGGGGEGVRAMVLYISWDQ